MVIHHHKQKLNHALLSPSSSLSSSFITILIIHHQLLLGLNRARWLVSQQRLRPVCSLDLLVMTIATMMHMKMTMTMMMTFFPRGAINDADASFGICALAGVYFEKILKGSDISVGLLPLGQILHYTFFFRFG